MMCYTRSDDKLASAAMQMTQSVTFSGILINTQLLLSRHLPGRLSQAMTRWYTLILFTFGVIYASGIPLPLWMGNDCASVCGSHSAPEIEPDQSCCPLGDTIAQSQQDQSDEYCPMSGGPCVCGINPADDRRPNEPMPLPQRDRDSLQMVRGPPASIQIILTQLPMRLVSMARTGSIRAGFSHNQAQALLGVWQR